jgi:peptidoglycan/LPS O-acetylase OafA/YrhL
LAILAQKHPSFAMGMTLGLLLAGAIEPVQQFAFGLVLYWGQVVQYFIASPGITDPNLPASGATMGAIAGAIIAAIAMRRDGTQSPSENTSLSRM